MLSQGALSYRGYFLACLLLSSLLPTFSIAQTPSCSTAAEEAATEEEECECGESEQDANSNGITDCRLTEEFADRVLTALTTLTPLRAPLAKKNKQTQNMLRESLNGLMQEISAYVTFAAPGLRLADTSTDLEALSKLAKRQVRQATAIRLKSFTRAKKRARKSLQALLQVLLMG